VTELVALDLRDRLDAEARVVRDVAVLGPESRNGRRYSDEALADAARVFEGAKVFANHRAPGSAHDVRDYIGRLEGLRVEDAKVRARELRVLNESYWPLVAIAERDPEAFGLSIEADVEIAPGPTPVVRRVLRAYSVDLVSEPATNAGLFEGVVTEPTIGNPPPRGGVKVQSLLFDKKRFTKAQAKAWAKDHGFRAGAVDEPEGGKYLRIRQLDPEGFIRFRVGRPLAPGVVPVYGVPKRRESLDDLEGTDMSIDWEKITLADLEQNAPDLLGELRESWQAEVEGLRQELERAQAELAAMKRRGLVEQHARELRLDGELPPALLRACERAEKDEEVKELLEAYAKRPGGAAKSRPSPLSPATGETTDYEALLTGSAPVF